MNKRTDRRFLTEVAYADGRGLADRTALYEYQRPAIDLVGGALTTLGPVRDAVVLDAGCGPGRYLPAMQAAGATVVALDLSAGMLAPLRSTRLPLIGGDAARLPLANRSTDVVLLMHMLYHVPDPAAAIREARRVLVPGGRLLVATAGEDHLAEMNDLWLEVLDEMHIGGDHDELSLVNRRYPPSEAREQLGAAFLSVSERRLTATIVVPDPSPVVRHAASTSAAHTSTSQHPEVLDRFRDQVAAAIADDGDYRATSATALFLAR